MPFYAITETPDLDEAIAIFPAKNAEEALKIFEDEYGKCDGVEYYVHKLEVLE